MSSTPATSYQRVTEWLIERIRTDGLTPWQRPWHVGSQAPRRADTERPYTGINRWLLLMSADSDPRYLTFAQARGLGGAVRKGSRGIPLVRVMEFRAREDEEDSEPEASVLRKRAKTFWVFNVSQIEGLELPPPPEEVRYEHAPIARYEGLVAPFLTGSGLTIETGGDRAGYRPATDTLVMPARERFVSAEAYYETLGHELGHATGHTSRLARESIGAAFGSPRYAFEELVAEMTSAFLAAHAGMPLAERENQAAYLADWLGRLEEDPTLLVRAAAAAERATRLILGERHADAQAAAEAVA